MRRHEQLCTGDKAAARRLCRREYSAILRNRESPFARMFRFRRQTPVCSRSRRACDLQPLNVTIVGSVPVQSASGDTKLPFRIEGKIDIDAIRSEACRRAALETMRALALDAATAAIQAEIQPVLMPNAILTRPKQLRPDDPRWKAWKEKLVASPIAAGLVPNS
jgi:hypothetical protein